MVAERRYLGATISAAVDLADRPPMVIDRVYDIFVIY
jgi:hypothetical protein